MAFAPMGQARNHAETCKRQHGRGAGPRVLEEGAQHQSSLGTFLNSHQFLKFRNIPEVAEVPEVSKVLEVTEVPEVEPHELIHAAPAFCGHVDDERGAAAEKG